MIYKHVVNLLHVLAFVAHFQGGIQQRKINTLMASYIKDAQ